MKYLEKINFPHFENNDFVVVLDLSHVKNEVKKVFKNKKAGFHCFSGRSILELYVYV